MKKVVLLLTIVALVFNLAAFAVFADDGLIPHSLVADAIEDGSAMVVLTAETGTVISAESLFAIRDSGIVMQFVLPNGVVVSIDPAKITDNARSADISVTILAVGNTDVLNGWGRPSEPYEDWYDGEDWYIIAEPPVRQNFEDYWALYGEYYREWYPDADWNTINNFKSWEEYNKFWNAYWATWNEIMSVWENYWALYGEYYPEWYPDIDLNVLNNLKSWDDYYKFWEDYWASWDERMSIWENYWALYSEHYLEWYPDADQSVLNNLKSWDDYNKFWEDYWDNWVYVPQPFEDYMAQWGARYRDWHDSEWYPDIDWAAFDRLKSWDEYEAFWDNYWDNWVNPFIYESFYEICEVNGIRAVWRDIRRETGEVTYEDGWWMDYRVLIIPAAEGELGFELSFNVPASVLEAAGIYPGSESVAVTVIESDNMDIYGRGESLPVNADGSVTVSLAAGNAIMLTQWYDWWYYAFDDEAEEWDDGAVLVSPGGDMRFAPAANRAYATEALEESGGDLMHTRMVMGGGGAFAGGFGVMYDAEGNLIDRSALARGMSLLALGNEFTFDEDENGMAIVPISADLDEDTVTDSPDDENPPTSARRASSFFISLVAVSMCAALVSRKRKK